jgi:hypothetical protein
LGLAASFFFVCLSHRFEGLCSSIYPRLTNYSLVLFDSLSHLHLSSQALHLCSDNVGTSKTVLDCMRKAKDEMTNLTLCSCFDKIQCPGGLLPQLTFGIRGTVEGNSNCCASSYLKSVRGDSKAVRGVQYCARVERNNAGLFESTLDVFFSKS